jgi:hypothetical protein
MRFPARRWIVDARWRRRRTRARIDWRVDAGFGRAGEVVREVADGIRRGDFTVTPADTLRIDRGFDEIESGIDPLSMHLPG